MLKNSCLWNDNATIKSTKLGKNNNYITLLAPTETCWSNANSTTLPGELDNNALVRLGNLNCQTVI